MRFLLALILSIVLVSPAYADTVCQIFPNTGGLPTASLTKRGLNASVHVVRIVGAGAFSLQLQESNIGGTSSTDWVNNGAAITTAGITKYTDVNSQYVRVGVNSLPPAGTQIKVCLYADAPLQ